MNTRENPKNRPNKETHMSTESGRRIGFIDYQLENFHAMVAWGGGRSFGEYLPGVPPC